MVAQILRQPYQGTRVYGYTIPGTPVLLTNTVTTGVLANEQPIRNTDIGAFSRFNALYDEFRIVSCTYEIIPLGIYTGVSAFFFSEVSLGTPILAEASQRNARFIKNNEQSPANLIMKWTNRDFSDASWFTSTSTVTVAYFYTYTDGANLGAPIVASQLWLLRPTLVMQFRGLKSA